MELARVRRWDWDAVTLWLPVVGVAVASQAGLGLEQPWAGPPTTLTVVALLLSAPLALRRRAPVAAAAVVAAAVPLQDAWGGSLSFGTFVAVLVAAHAVGRHASGARTAAGYVVVLAGVVLGVRESLPEDAAELVFPLFYITAAVSVGVVQRRLVSQAAELRELNAVMERERDATVRLAVAGERLRLSRDLHDSVAHTLTVAVVQAERCEQVLADDPEAATAAVRAVQDVGRRGLAELRSALRVMRDPEAPVREADLADLDALVKVMSGPDLVIGLTRSGEWSRVPDEVGRQLFRVAQEALTNVVKHSDACTADVAVRVTGDTVSFEVVDPGPPRDATLPSGGHGLPGMAERMAAVGGSLVSGRDGDGFRVVAEVPFGPMRTSGALS